MALVATISACGGGSGAVASAPTPPSPPPTAPSPPPTSPSPPPTSPSPPAPPGSYTLAPLGTPRILVSHAPTMARLRTMLSTNAPAATRFRNMVDAQLAGSDFYAFEPWYAALLAQVTGTASYCTYAVAQTEAFVASEEARIGNNQRASVADDSYLEVGGVVGNLSLVYDWCRAQMTDAQRSRWRTYANQAVWNVWHPTQARWGNTTYAWSGWSVDNPVNNYYYSFLRATMTLGLATYGENDMAQGWLDQFRVAKIGGQLVPTFNSDLVGGGSREGTGYGTAMASLWRLYDWWEKSTGERIADLTPHTYASMAALMHAITPTLDRLAPTGDHARDSTAALFDYHRDYLQQLIRLYPGDRLSGAARTLLAQSSVPKMALPFMYYSDYLYEHGDVAAQPLSVLSTAYWAKGTGQFPARSQWAADAAYMNFICGPYTESHAHHDQGSFVIFHKDWLAYDANIDSHSGLAQDEVFHNLVRFEQNGSVVPQRFGTSCEMRAVYNGPRVAYASARVTPVYGAPGPVTLSEREMVFVRPGLFVVLDRAQAAAGTLPIWTLNLPGMPTVTGNTISYASAHSRLDVVRLLPAAAEVQAIPNKQTSPDFDSPSSTRVDVKGNPAAPDFVHVIGVGGSVTQAELLPVSDGVGGKVIAVHLASGEEVRIFLKADDRTSGVIEIRNSSGTITDTIALPQTVQAIPLFAN